MRINVNLGGPFEQSRTRQPPPRLSLSDIKAEINKLPTSELEAFELSIKLELHRRRNPER